MKYCVKCGKPLDDYILICPHCGTRLDKVPLSQKGDKRKSRNLFITILLWLFFWPVMIIIATVKSKKIPLFAKALILCAYFSLFLIPPYLSSKAPSESLSSISSDRETESLLFSDVFKDESLRINFLTACQEIGMDPTEISQLNPVDNWAGGPRYSFTYKTLSCRLYCNTDSTVNCIKLGNDIDVYKQGFEPYQIADYIVDNDIAVELQILSEEQVKTQLNFPSTANFPWEGWTYGRERDLYSVSNTVLAENAFGSEEESYFKLIYQASKNSFQLMYFELNGSCLVNHMDTISMPERKSVNTSAATLYPSNGEILLIDGQKGDYGRSIDIDGTSYINYYVPAGSYHVTSNVNWCKVYIADDNYFVNSDGYTENEVIETLEFSSLGETQSVSIEEGQHIELTISARVTLTPDP